MANKYEGLRGFGPEIRETVKTAAEGNKLNYDPHEWTRAEPIVKNELSRQWITKLAEKFQDEDPEELTTKVYKSLGVNRTTFNSPEEFNEFQNKVVERTIEFQKENGLVPDGIIGPKTLEALDKATGYDSSFNGSVKRKDGTPYEPIGGMPEETEGQDMMLQSGGEKQRLSPEERATRKALRKANKTKKEQKEIGNTTMDGLIKAKEGLVEAEKGKQNKENEFKNASEENDKSYEEEQRAKSSLESAKNSSIEADIAAGDAAVDKDNAEKALEEIRKNEPDNAEKIKEMEAKVEEEKNKQRSAVIKSKEAEEALVLAQKTLADSTARRKAALEKFGTAKKGLEDAEAVVKNHQILKENLEKINLQAAEEARKAELAAQELKNPEPAKVETTGEETESTMPIAEPVSEEEATDSEESTDVPQEQESETTEAVDESPTAQEAAPATAPSTSSDENERIPEPKAPKQTDAADNL